jgi:hypothetical protein
MGVLPPTLDASDASVFANLGSNWFTETRAVTGVSTTSSGGTQVGVQTTLCSRLLCPHCFYFALLLRDCVATCLLPIRSNLTVLFMLTMRPSCRG